MLTYIQQRMFYKNLRLNNIIKILLLGRLISFVYRVAIDTVLRARGGVGGGKAILEYSGCEFCHLSDWDNEICHCTPIYNYKFHCNCVSLKSDIRKLHL